MSGWYPPPYAFGTPKMREEVTTAQPSCTQRTSASGGARPQRPARAAKLSARMASLSQPLHVRAVVPAAAEAQEPKKKTKKTKKLKRMKKSRSSDEPGTDTGVDRPVLRCLPSGEVATHVAAGATNEIRTGHASDVCSAVAPASVLTSKIIVQQR